MKTIVIVAVLVAIFAHDCQAQGVFFGVMPHRAQHGYGMLGMPMPFPFMHMPFPMPMFYGELITSTIHHIMFI